MTKAKEEKVITKTPSGFSVVAREFKKEYLEKSNTDVKFEADINLHSPLEQII